jgi:response regulator of citrate/malate metabolism
VRIHVHHHHHYDDADMRELRHRLERLESREHKMRELLMATKEEIDQKLDEQLRGVSEATTLLDGIKQWGDNLTRQLEEIKSSSGVDDATAAKIDAVSAAIKQHNELARALVEGTSVPKEEIEPQA